MTKRSFCRIAARVPGRRLLRIAFVERFHEPRDTQRYASAATLSLLGRACLRERERERERPAVVPPRRHPAHVQLAAPLARAPLQKGLRAFAFSECSRARGGSAPGGETVLVAETQGFACTPTGAPFTSVTERSGPIWTIPQCLSQEPHTTGSRARRGSPATVSESNGISTESQTLGRRGGGRRRRARPRPAQRTLLSILQRRVGYSSESRDQDGAAETRVFEVVAYPPNRRWRFAFRSLLRTTVRFK